MRSFREFSLLGAAGATNDTAYGRVIDEQVRFLQSETDGQHQGGVVATAPGGAS